MDATLYLEKKNKLLQVLLHRYVKGHNLSEF